MKAVLITLGSIAVIGGVLLVFVLFKRAVASTPTSAMADTGKVMPLTKPGMILLFAGDQPGSTAYGEYAIPIEAGSYRILEGHYKVGQTEEVYIYRLQPKTN